MKIKQHFTTLFFKHKIIWPLVALVVIFLFNLIFTPEFFRLEIKNGHLFGSLIDILNRATPLIIMAIGMTLVIATAGIDISVGAVTAISGAVACRFIQGGYSVFIAILFALLCGAICGLWNGTLVAKLGIQPMVGTLILMTIGRGIAQLITNAQIITVNNKAYGFIGSGFLFGLPFSVYIAATVILFTVLIMRKTSLGLFLESVGANRESSRFAGIKSSNIILSAYLVCGLLAGLSGILISSNVTAADANNAGLWMEIDAILATVIGGTMMTGGRAYIGGTVLGALFIQSLTTTIYALGVPPEVILVIKAIVVIIVSLLQSSTFRKTLTGVFKKKEGAAA